MKKNYRPFEPNVAQLGFLSRQSFMARWEQPRQWFVQDKFQFVHQATYPFQVTKASDTTVDVADGWLVRDKFTTSALPDRIRLPERVDGTSSPLTVSNGDTVYLKATYAKGTLSIDAGAAPHSLDVGGTPVSGFLSEDVYGTAAASTAYEAGVDLEGDDEIGYWPLAEITIADGIMTIRQVFTGGVIPLYSVINIPE